MKESMEEIINIILESMKSLNRQAFSVYKPIVDEICSGRAVEEKELENVLDGLVSVCMSDEMLDLFKRVCRKFYYQYPEIITDYHPESGTFRPALNTEASLNITYNYGHL